MECWANGYMAIVGLLCQKAHLLIDQKSAHSNSQTPKKRFALWLHWIHIMTAMNGIYFKCSFESNWLPIVFLSPTGKQQQQQHADCEVVRYFSALLPNWTVYLEKLPMQHKCTLIQWEREGETLSPLLLLPSPCYVTFLPWNMSMVLMCT